MYTHTITSLQTQDIWQKLMVILSSTMIQRKHQSITSFHLVYCHSSACFPIMLRKIFYMHVNGRAQQQTRTFFMSRGDWSTPGTWQTLISSSTNTHPKASWHLTFNNTSWLRNYWLFLVAFLCDPVSIRLQYNQHCPSIHIQVSYLSKQCHYSQLLWDKLDHKSIIVINQTSVPQNGPSGRESILT